MATKAKRLTLHGDRDQGDRLITRLEITGDGELAVDTWDSGASTSVVYSRGEMARIHAFVGRALTSKPKKKGA